MSFAAIKVTPLLASRALRIPRPTAAFHTSLIRAGLNETDRANDKDRTQPEERIELSKKESVTKREWKPELASNSEQNIRHEKHNMTFEEMQAEGAKKSEEGKEPKKSTKTTGV